MTSCNIVQRFPDAARRERIRINAVESVETFGEVVAEYTSEVAGEVGARRSDATAEPGVPLLAILYNDAIHEFPVDYSE